MSNLFIDYETSENLFESNIEFDLIPSTSLNEIQYDTQSYHEEELDSPAVLLVNDDYQNENDINNQYSSIKEIADNQNSHNSQDTASENIMSSTSSHNHDSKTIKINDNQQRNKNPNKNSQTNIVSTKSSNQNMWTLITSAFNKVITRQHEIDQGTYSKTGPGRVRK